jgi:hypothetical protein
MHRTVRERTIRLGPAGHAIVADRARPVGQWSAC